VPNKLRHGTMLLLAIVISATGSLGGILPASAIGGSSWTTYHLEPGRSGNDTGEPSMSGITTNWTSPVLDGRTYGEPLVLNNVVYTATQQNSLYVLDAGDGHVLWSLHLDQAPYNLHPVPLSLVNSTAGFSGCGNIDPLGITGTPVIDPALGASGTLFAVAEAYDGTNGSSIHHELVAVDLSSHTATHTLVDPPGVGFDTGAKRAVEQQRGALTLTGGLSGGNVVVPLGGLAGDCGPYHGFALSMLESLSGAVNTFEVDATNAEGGIWAASGPAVDGSGNVYVATGNGTEPTNAYENSDGVIKLDSTMHRLDYFAPTVWHADNAVDADLGSQGPLLVPRATGAPLVFQTGKQNIGFLLDSSNLGQIGGQLFPPVSTQSTTGHVCDGQAFGGSAYNAPYVYVPCSEGIRALLVDTSAPSFSRAWHGPSDATGPPIVAGGLVWVHGGGRLYGLDPSSGATTVTLSGVDTAYNFSTPAASGGNLLYAGNNAVRSFSNRGLLRVVSSPAQPTQILLDGQIADSWGLTWLKLLAGSHTVCFAHVDGYTEPGCQSVTVNPGTTTTVTGTFTQRGSLRVITSPAVPSQISVDGNPTDDWGMWTDVPAGSHTVCFGAVAGFNPPGCQTVTVTAGALTTVTGTFTSNPSALGQSGVGSLRVMTSPALPSQVTIKPSAGSPYIADTWGLTWLELAPGSYTVSFSHVTGWNDPAPQTITITAGNTTTVTGTFTQRGFLRVTTSPAAPGTISVDGIPRDDWGMWTDIPTGSHTVCFGAAASFANTPACQSVTVNAGATTTATGVYS
jgi:hypothetical protein